jgi:hypothetical protein
MRELKLLHGFFYGVAVAKMWGENRYLRAKLNFQDNITMCILVRYNAYQRKLAQ